MNKNRPIFSDSKPRFSRTGLNIMIIITSLMILLFSQSHRFTEERPDESPVADTGNTENHAEPRISETGAGTTEAAQAEARTVNTVAGEATSADKGAGEDVREVADSSNPSQSNNSTNPAHPTPSPLEIETLKQIPLIPPPAPALSYEHWTTEKGAKVYYIHAPDIPMVDLRITFAAGASREKPPQAGVAQLANALLAEGSQSHTVDEIAAIFENLGAAFSSSSHRDMAIVGLRVLTDPEYLHPALLLFAEVIGLPQYHEEAFDRNVKVMQLGLEREKQSPGRLAAKAFYQQLYPQHPYGHSPSGTESSLKSISTTDLKAFHKRYYVAQNSNVTIVGAVTKAEAETIVDQALQHLHTGQPALLTDSAPTPSAIHHHHIEFPSQQTHILIGLPGVKKQDPIIPYLYLANEIFGGGGFSSILLQEIREERGLSYSASSYYYGMQAEGPFIIKLQTKKASAKEAIDITLSELQKFLKNGPTTEQLDDARSNILASFPKQLASNRSILGHFGSVGFYDLPHDYLDHFYETISKATAEETAAAFRKVVDMSKLTIITAGPEKPSVDLNLTSPTPSSVAAAEAQQQP